MASGNAASGGRRGQLGRLWGFRKRSYCRAFMLVLEYDLLCTPCSLPSFCSIHSTNNQHGSGGDRLQEAVRVSQEVMLIRPPWGGLLWWGWGVELMVLA